MGMFTAPTNDEVGAALADAIGNRPVQACVIGQSGSGGRVAIVATDVAVHVVRIGMFKLKPTQVVADHPLGTATASRSGLKFKVAKNSVKLGLADNARAAALETYINSRVSG